MSGSSFARKLLIPLTPLYRLGLALRELRLARGWEPVSRLRFPVVSIGNLSTGGSGKTPLAIVLAQALTRRGIAVDVLSRGYGRSDRHPARVDPAGSAEEYGDEPLLIARTAAIPVYVARRRYDAGLLAEADALRVPAQQRPRVPHPWDAVQSQGWETTNPSLTLARGLNPPSATEIPLPRLHILDDGFQHRQLHRDLDILLLSRADWKDRLLPAGNLREPQQAARQASVLAIPSDDPAFEADLRAWGWDGPIWRLRRRMEVPEMDGRVVGFCGIARPRQFFAGLEAAGLPLAVAIAYPDHHRFTPRNLQSILLAARSHGARALVTTEKDLVRLGPLAAILPADLPLHTARLHVEIEDEAAALDWIADRLNLPAHHLGL